MDTFYRVIEKDIYIKSLTEKIIINPFGDIHRDSASCDVDRWRWWLTRMKKEHNSNTYYIGMGDYHDFASDSERIILNNPKLHDDSKFKFDESMEKSNRDLCKEIEFMKPNLLGLIEGNHKWITVTGKTSTEDLAERMNTVDLGWLCHLTIKVNQAYTSQDRNISSIHIVLCHGKAGGKTHGITINQVGDLKNIFPVADIYIMGHDHQRGAWPCSVLVPFRDRTGTFYMKQKRQFLARSGAFLKAYSDNKSTYSVKSLYKPSDLGAIQFRIGFHRDKSITDRIITDIEAII